MSGYSLYFIDVQNRIRRVTRFEAATDAAALLEAESHVAWGVLELWEGGRPIVRLEKGLQKPITGGADQTVR